MIVLPDHELFTINETCAILKISRDTIYELFRKGQLQYIFVGKHRRIRRGDLLAYLDRPILEVQQEQLTPA